MMAERISGIYKIECLVNGKVYIGQSVNIIRRFTVHKSQLRNNTHINSYLQRSWDKYGEENFTFEIVEECKENINEREIHWIEYFDSLNNGYNLTAGGFGGQRGVPKSDKWYESMRKMLKNRIISKETGRRISQSKMGTKMSDEQKEFRRKLMLEQYENGERSRDNYWARGSNSKNAVPIYQFDFNTLNIIKMFDCVSDAEREFNSDGGISACINRRQVECGGFYWQKVSDTVDGKYIGKTKNKIRPFKKPVKQIDIKTNEVINKFNSASDANKHIGKTHANSDISACCRGVQKTAFGYKWEYIEENK